MKKLLCSFLSFTLAIIFILQLSVFAASESEGDEITVLFTHDLHSHLLPSRSDDGGEYGGYARLMHAINEEKKKDPNALLVDGGDFSMGSLFQTAYAQSALELRIMGAMGYDATTLGNHEFDYLQGGLVSMLNAAVDSNDRLPAIVNCNYLPPSPNEESHNEDLTAAFERYGVKDYVILERGGTYFVIFGLFGLDADDCAPNSGMKLTDPVEAAQRTVDAAIAECLEKYSCDPVVICLSHGGTTKKKGEDYELAKKTKGIDLIVSGHSHSTLTEPVIANGTIIVSAAEYGRYLGVCKIKQSSEGEVSLSSYELVPINESTPEDSTIAALVEEYKIKVEENYLSRYGVGFDEVLVSTDIVFETLKQVKSTQHESTVCNLFSDAYKWAAENALGRKVDVALTAAGVVRESLPTGDITTSDVFNAASLGVGTEGELVAVYVTGTDLKNAFEVDASVQPLMKSAQLYFSGAEYSFNKRRMIFNKVDYSMLRRDDGSLEEINDETLYLVVTGMYAGQMLGSVEETSMGILTITPRDESGAPIDRAKLSEYVIRDKNGDPVKEWYAIASYLKEKGADHIEKNYSETDGRKVVYSSLNPIKLLSNANIFTYLMLGLILVLVAVAVLITLLIIKKIKKAKGKKKPPE
ncbi:MAG: bifunctional metallophosphatase/5'-nucleotidase [Clostridia bacterium]|nr:bifunctional metallophosphatase/5'-nucleotidase [Clostridia bacterium]